MQNLHPLFVHFPIALLVTAVVLGLVSSGDALHGLRPIARGALYLGALAAIAAVVTGYLGRQTVAHVSAAREPLEDHQTFAFITLGVGAALAAWSLVAGRRGLDAPRPTWLWALGLVALGTLVALTANEGGELVYEHGVGTALTARGGPLAEPAQPPAVPRGTRAGRAVGDTLPVNEDFH